MDNHNVKLNEIEHIYGKISPFEFKNKLISLAKGHREESVRTLLDAGRGNPNWTAAEPREAFFSLGQFAVLETRRIWSDNKLAGMPEKEGISKRLKAYISDHSTDPGIALLDKIIDYGVSILKFNEDNWVYELTDGIIGDNYPIPDRMLTHIEKIVHQYLIKELGYNNNYSHQFDLFAVEGATAAMCYIFDSLIANNLLNTYDKIAIMVPIFTPYLEIPHLKRYNFEVIEIYADELTEDGTHTWQYPADELKKLCDKSVKALFVVNPSNPPSVSMKPEVIMELIEIVNIHNPNLIIISDDVYCTFVDNFQSLAASLPFNTIGVYSFSKYFGATGWRLGVISVNKVNVFDYLLRNLPIDKRDELNKRYESLTNNPLDIPFIDRIVADSRQVALNHTSGLSTPQQVQMALFAGFALLDLENNYKKLTISICHRRQKLLFEGLGLDLRYDKYDAAYYTEFDLLEWANYNFDKAFGVYLQDNYKPIDILFRLAEESSIVLLSGAGFHGPEWSIRISLANLNDENYSIIGKVLHKVLEGYVNDWKTSKLK
jgi:aspartate 4-decarboxylase